MTQGTMPERVPWVGTCFRGQSWIPRPSHGEVVISPTPCMVGPMTMKPAPSPAIQFLAQQERSGYHEPFNQGRLVTPAVPATHDPPDARPSPPCAAARQIRPQLPLHELRPGRQTWIRCDACQRCLEMALQNPVEHRGLGGPAAILQAASPGSDRNLQHSRDHDDSPREGESWRFPGSFEDSWRKLKNRPDSVPGS